jgi:hypothetical protein
MKINEGRAAALFSFAFFLFLCHSQGHPVTRPVDLPLCYMTRITVLCNISTYTLQKVTIVWTVVKRGQNSAGDVAVACAHARVEDETHFHEMGGGKAGGAMRGGTRQQRV